MIRDLHKRRRGNNSDFELEVPTLIVRSGEIAVLQGVSGSGKSTLLDILALALRPDQSRQFRFAPHTNLLTEPGLLWKQGDKDALARLRCEHMGYVLQTGGLLSFLNVQENIELPCRLLGKTSEYLDEVVARLAISPLLDKFPQQLSVGERQRVAIARALVHRPSVILADEPTASLDPFHASVVFDLFLKLVERFGVTAIIASHDHQRIAELGLQPLSHRLEREGTLTRALFWS